jgi:2,4-dienoyl-CoA reductase-like NADH-dependent reductase (Old Yellow Enzyme family)
MSALFTAVSLGPRIAPNRIAVSPMCQYSATGGMPTDWHLQNTMTHAMSGAGLVMMEATAVEERGRITHGCLGIYSDSHQAAIAKVIAAAREVASKDVLFGIQLAHAGRKGSARRPWEGGQPLGPDERPWITVAPSPIAFAEGWARPRELATSELEIVKQAFVAAARRATQAGFDVIELHAAHGYLIHQFSFAAEQWPPRRTWRLRETDLSAGDRPRGPRCCSPVAGAGRADHRHRLGRRRVDRG